MSLEKLRYFTPSVSYAAESITHFSFTLFPNLKENLTLIHIFKFRRLIVRGQIRKHPL
jgi:hypothetical protein